MPRGGVPEVVQQKGQFDCPYPECSPRNCMIVDLNWFLYPAVSIGVMAGDMVYGIEELGLFLSFCYNTKVFTCFTIQRTLSKIG